MELQFDPYSVLGISANATNRDIKRAYRRLARRLHPDVNPGNPAAAMQFQDITWAYNILTDPIGKTQVDRQIEDNRQGTNTYFSLRVTPSKRTIAVMPEEQMIYLLAELHAAPQQEEVKRTLTKLNLTLVVDQSNSMNGSRMNRVKVAAQRLIDALTPDDILSIVGFNDRASVVLPATYANDKPQLKARVSIMASSGGTEIYRGLEAGIQENRKQFNPGMVNHILLLTDGHTYGDQERCLQLARDANNQGVSISVIGLGHDWNDKFLDSLAAIAGGTSSYIDTPDKVVGFFNEHVRSLTDVFSERLVLSVAPDPDVNIEMAFKLSPSPQSLELVDGRIPLGSLEAKRAVSLLLQFQLPANMPEGFRTVARLVAMGDIMQNDPQAFQVVSDISLEVAKNPHPDEPPQAIMDALSKLTLYRMQERAQHELEAGNVDEATRLLEHLATRLLERGHSALATTTLNEASQLKRTRTLTDAGQKTLKYSTRALVRLDEEIASLMDEN
ncbi:MAG: VWA domain-containing protein [Anaerolineae bacterium]|nr:VWA domain-containing protein [Anaerolineae bacterium]